MEHIEIMDLWKLYDKKLEDNLALNRKNAEDITRMKIRSFLASMKPLKIFTILAGIVWVGFIDMLIIKLFPFASVFFIVSMGIQVLLTKIAIGVYLYQLILIYQTDISEPILETQERIARLRSSTLWVARLLFLQFPVWTTFYWSKGMFEHGNIWLIVLQVVITLAFIFLAIWLFLNIRFENRNKRWFKLIFNGKEWNPVIQSMELLDQVNEHKNEQV